MCFQRIWKIRDRMHQVLNPKSIFRAIITEQINTRIKDIVINTISLCTDITLLFKRTVAVMIIDLANFLVLWASTMNKVWRTYSCHMNLAYTSTKTTDDQTCGLKRLMSFKRVYSIICLTFFMRIDLRRKLTQIFIEQPCSYCMPQCPDLQRNFVYNW